MSETLWLVVPAAGQGKRMGADRPKQYLSLDGQPILAHTLARLAQAFPEAHLVLCLDRDDGWFDPHSVPFKRWQRVDGGQERMHSVLNALRAIPARADDIVMVHDVARPCITQQDLLALHAAIQSHSAGALLAMPVADTMKRDRGDQCSLRTEPRDGLWHALTPQGFRYALLVRALEQAVQHGTLVTDEASAVEALGEAPRLVSGRRDNLKVTHPGDLALAGAILHTQQAAASMADNGNRSA
ncbi:2-C-methyl-D-erythritol 4-phosphate cytidylyltransferase [Vreelandella venusta]|jgi:2-C-methyl-D-erythritol 4-phosphate cytidylyltransferase|nr:2-C-methyl-D-erythritol 4-phosphate cytidylyltransferase [Halomonas hydrothermalis]